MFYCSQNLRDNNECEQKLCRILTFNHLIDEQPDPKSKCRRNEAKIAEKKCRYFFLHSLSSRNSIKRHLEFLSTPPKGRAKEKNRHLTTTLTKKSLFFRRFATTLEGIFFPFPTKKCRNSSFFLAAVKINQKAFLIFVNAAEGGAKKRNFPKM